MALKPCKECGKEISTEAKACPHCGKKNPTGPKVSIASMGCLFIIIIMVVSMMSSADKVADSIGIASQAGSPAAPPPSPKETALAQVKLDFTWGKTGFDNIMEANFTVTNPTAYRIKDIEITCTHFAASGTKIDSNTRTIYEIVPAKGKRIFPKFDMGFIHTQVKSSSCQITDLVVM